MPGARYVSKSKSKFRNFLSVVRGSHDPNRERIEIFLSPDRKWAIVVCDPLPWGTGDPLPEKKGFGRTGIHLHLCQKNDWPSADQSSFKAGENLHNKHFPYVYFNGLAKIWYWLLG